MKWDENIRVIALWIKRKKKNITGVYAQTAHDCTVMMRNKKNMTDVYAQTAHDALWIEQNYKNITGVCANTAYDCAVNWAKQ